MNESLNKLKNQPLFLDLQDKGGHRTRGCPTTGETDGWSTGVPACQGRVTRLTTDSAAALEPAWHWQAKGSVEQNGARTEIHISTGTTFDDRAEAVQWWKHNVLVTSTRTSGHPHAEQESRLRLTAAQTLMQMDHRSECRAQT